eukprot:gnl/Spiro4/5331_TR2705_c0_g1_i1.p1 gnl/Spiro4/5331_TR2705_c0_g1~~gnl/Spiro4/5331_TR2705_c0_g1_i1.p1  ORF type:complete len:642 (+),score=156.05 gnl/Spiro4/5331_TR2705_c0_g1_i1:760-2685(+)
MVAKSKGERKREIDVLGERMKQYEAAAQVQRRLDPTLPFLARIDGHKFSTFTRGFKKPHDLRISDSMTKTTEDLVDMFQAATGYTQSDEITLVWPAANAETNQTLIFGGKTLKIATLLAGYASTRFAFHMSQCRFDETEDALRLKCVVDPKMYFDARVHNVPSVEEALANVMWRSLHDCPRNAASRLASAHFSSKQLFKLGTRAQIEKLAAIGVAFDCMPIEFRFGSFSKKEMFDKESLDPRSGQTITAKRTRIISRGYRLSAAHTDYGVKLLFSKYWPPPPPRPELEALDSIKRTCPHHAVARHFDAAWFATLDNDAQDELLLCLRGVLAHCGTSATSTAPASESSGALYARQWVDYIRFEPFFSQIIAELHGSARHTPAELSWTAPTRVSPAGVECICVSVSRNLTRFPFTGALSLKQRLAVERTVCFALDKFAAANPSFAGRYYSLTPGHPQAASDSELQSLRELMFEDLRTRPRLASAGIADDWPHGRGCYVSTDRAFVAWGGEQDHIRLCCRGNTAAHVDEMLARLNVAATALAATLVFAALPAYGFLTADLALLGCGFRASAVVTNPTSTPTPIYERRVVAVGADGATCQVDVAHLATRLEVEVVPRLGTSPGRAAGDLLCAVAALGHAASPSST